MTRCFASADSLRTCAVPEYDEDLPEDDGRRRRSFAISPTATVPFSMRYTWHWTIECRVPLKYDATDIDWTRCRLPADGQSVGCRGEARIDGRRRRRRPRGTTGIRSGSAARVAEGGLVIALAGRSPPSKAWASMALHRWCRFNDAADATPMDCQASDAGGGLRVAGRVLAHGMISGRTMPMAGRDA